MKAVRKQALLICCGVAALVLGLIVLATAHDWQEHLLAALGVVGGIAIVIVALPTDKDDR